MARAVNHVHNNMIEVAWWAPDPVSSAMGDRIAQWAMDTHSGHIYKRTGPMVSRLGNPY